MKKLLVLSGKGGTGKTTTAAAFIQFAQAKAMADCDVDAPNLHLITECTEKAECIEFVGADKAKINPQKCIGCGVCIDSCRFSAIQQQNGICTVQEYTCEGCGVCAYVCPQQAVEMIQDVAGEQILFRGEKVFSTATLKMGRGNSGKLVTAVKFAMLNAAEKDIELAIIDGSPGIGCPVIASMSGMDFILIVAEPSRSGLSDLERLFHTATGFGVHIAVCVNKWNISPEITTEIEQFCHTNQIPYVGNIPYDKHASQAINAGRSLAEIECPARDALWNIYQKILKLMGVHS